MSTINQRRELFRQYFPMIQTAKPMQNKKGAEDLQNSCPACGFLTLMSRGGYDICPFCFWEDEGFDEAQLKEISEANECTLEEYRQKNEEAIQTILNADFPDGSIGKDVQQQLLSFDKILNNFSENRRKEIFTEQGKMIALFTFNKIFGIHALIEKLNEEE